MLAFSCLWLHAWPASTLEKTPIAGGPAIGNIPRLFPGKILIDRYCPAWLNGLWKGQN
jgi:hypothetical protein